MQRRYYAEIGIRKLERLSNSGGVGFEDKLPEFLAIVT